MSSPGSEPARWVYRFTNFTRAYERMSELITRSTNQSLSDVEQEALVGRFSVAWELAWKLLKDYLQYSGVALETITPRSVIRAAFAAELIPATEPWLAALDARNAMAHTYNAELFAAVVADVMAVYHPVFTVVFERFQTLALRS